MDFLVGESLRFETLRPNPCDSTAVRIARFPRPWSPNSGAMSGIRLYGTRRWQGSRHIQETISLALSCGMAGLPPFSKILGLVEFRKA